MPAPSALCVVAHATEVVGVADAALGLLSKSTQLPTQPTLSTLSMGHSSAGHFHLPLCSPFTALLPRRHPAPRPQAAEYWQMVFLSLLSMVQASVVWVGMAAGARCLCALESTLCALACWCSCMCVLLASTMRRSTGIRDGGPRPRLCL